MITGYPVYITIRDRPCLVVGGGRIAARKILGLLRAGARVRVVTVMCGRQCRRLSGAIEIVQRPFVPEDIHPGLALVIGATNDPAVNREISSLAEKLGILCNIVDCPQLCSFTAPAVVRRGPLSIAVGTGGASPRLSRYVKTRIASCIGPEYALLATYLAEVRTRVQELPLSGPARARFWESVFESDPVELEAVQGIGALRERVEGLIDDALNGTASL